MTTQVKERWWDAPTVAVRPEPFGGLAYDFDSRRLALLRRPASPPLVEQFERGLEAPICLTWELTYACNLACAHCLSSSGRRDPDELTTEQCETLIDQMQAMGVFYVNIGGGEPTVRPDFWHLVQYAVSHNVGVKFSTNGNGMTAERARLIAATDYVDVQVSLDGATPEVNDYVRGRGSFAMATAALQQLRDAGFENAKISVACTRHNVEQLDELLALADSYGATLRLTRLRPSGRAVETWDDLHLLPEQQPMLYRWLTKHGDRVLTGDSFFHLSPLGEPLPGLNMCGAGRIVCLIDPVGDVYACPFAIHDRFKAGNVSEYSTGFAGLWREAPLFAALREPSSPGACGGCAHYDACRGGCMAAKFFTGMPLDGPDPECVQGHGVQEHYGDRVLPAPSKDHSRTHQSRNAPVMLTLQRRPPERACSESPVLYPEELPVR